MRTSMLMVLLSLLASGCSFITASGFEECKRDSDCNPPRADGGFQCRGDTDCKVCADSFCIGLPAGCTDTYGDVNGERKIPISVVFPLTSGGLDGGVAEAQVQRLNAVALAVEEINQRQGVAGRTFALYACNTGNDIDILKAQVTWMTTELQVPALMTTGSSQTLAASALTIGKGTLLLSPSATSPEITSLLDQSLVWRTAPSDLIQGRVIAQVLADTRYFTTAPTKLGIIYVNDPYGQGLKDVIVQRYTGAGRTVSQFFYDRGSSEQIIQAVGLLAAQNPQVTVLIGFPDDSLRVLQASRPFAQLKQPTHRWFFTDSSKDPALLTAGQDVVSAYGTAPAQGAGPEFENFKARFQQAFGKDPSNFAFTSHSYDAMYLVALGTAWSAGTSNAPVTGAGIAEGLQNVSSTTGSPFVLQPTQFTQAASAMQSKAGINVTGSSGKLDFDSATGEAPSPVELWQVTPDGTAFQTVTTIEPPAN
jgi:branched-chain amino acid transport system substrate-binding protein